MKKKEPTQPTHEDRRVSTLAFFLSRPRSCKRILARAKKLIEESFWFDAHPKMHEGLAARTHAPFIAGIMEALEFQRGYEGPAAFIPMQVVRTSAKYATIEAHPFEVLSALENACRSYRLDFFLVDGRKERPILPGSRFNWETLLEKIGSTWGTPDDFWSSMQAVRIRMPKVFTQADTSHSDSLSPLATGEADLTNKQRCIVALCRKKAHVLCEIRQALEERGIYDGISESQLKVDLALLVKRGHLHNRRPDGYIATVL